MNIPASLIQAANAYARTHDLDVISIFDHDSAIKVKIDDIFDRAQSGKIDEDGQFLIFKYGQMADELLQ